MKTHTEILIENVKRMLTYVPETGKFFWKEGQYARRMGKIGQEAGCLHRGGHRQIGLGQGQFQTHQLVWLLEKGYLPREIDHINRDPADNRIENLREVSRTVNLHNRDHRKDNVSGVKGVSKHSCGKWQAEISHDRERIYLGLHESFEDAVKARRDKEIELGIIPEGKPQETIK